MQMLWSSLLNFGKDWLQLLKKLENSFPGGAQCFLWSFYFFHTLKSSAIAEIYRWFRLDYNSKMNNLVPRTFSVARVSSRFAVKWSWLVFDWLQSCNVFRLHGQSSVRKSWGGWIIWKATISARKFPKRLWEILPRPSRTMHFGDEADTHETCTNSLGPRDPKGICRGQ